MAGILAIARAQFRAHRFGLLAFGILAGLLAAGVLGAFAGAVRTQTAFDRLARVTKVDDVRVSAYQPEVSEIVTGLPQVRRSWKAGLVIGQLEGPQVIYMVVAAGPERSRDLLDPVLIRGRMPDPANPNEVVLFEEFVERTGFDFGDPIKLKLITKEEFFQFDVGFGEPDGPSLSLEPVGVVRAPDAGEGVLNVLGTPALAERLARTDLVVGELVLARLAGGRAGVEPFAAALADATKGLRPPEGAEEFQPYEFSVPIEGRTAVQASAGVLVAGLLAVGLVVLAAGAFVVGQAMARRHGATADEQFVEAALGMTRLERAAGRALPSALAAVIAGVLAGAGSFVVSRWTPAGVISRFEPAPGAMLDPRVMIGGGFAIALLFVLGELVAAARAGRARSAQPRAHPSVIAERVASLGGRPSVVVGLRNAFERRGAGGVVPSRSALAAATVGIAGVIAVAVFTASLQRLATTPARYGWDGDLMVVDIKPDQRQALAADPRVGALAIVAGGAARTTAGTEMTLYSIEPVKGAVGWTMLEGRTPRSANEVALGSRMSEQLGLGVGETISFADAQGSPSTTAIVVGVGVGPMTNSEPLGLNLLVHPDGYDAISNIDPFLGGLVRAAPGVDGAKLAEQLGADAEVVPREIPPEVMNLQNLGVLPALLGLLLAVIAAAAIANALLVGMRRRRLEVGVLKTIGLTPGEVRASVFVTAVAVVLVSLAVGAPFGLAGGSSLWGAVARTSRVGDDALIPAATVALAAAGAIVVTLALAAWPARRSAREKPAEALRAE